MAKTNFTPLEEKLRALPKTLPLKDIVVMVEKANISERTFARDRKAKGGTIPYERLQVYAALLNCEVSELIDSFVKVKPLIKATSIAKKVGLKQ